jgi:hypothetical protein
MKKTVLVAAIAAPALVGCVRTPFPTLEDKMDGMKGGPVKTVIDKLGNPQSATEAADEKVYVWSASGVEALGFNCTIKVFANRNDKVTHYGYDGTVAGCAHYAHRLDKKYDLLRSTVPMPPNTSPSPPPPSGDNHNPA